MPTIANLRVVLDLAAAPFHAGLHAAARSLRTFRVEMANVFAHIGPFTLRMGPAAASAVTLARAFTDLVTSAVSTAAHFEHLEISFAGMLGSAEKAKKLLDELFQFAAVTPFTFQGVTEATQRLLAFGFTAEQSISIMKQMANIAAAMPEGIDEGLKRITRAIGEMRAKGRVSGQEMRQLADAGIPAWDALAERIGVSVPRAMKLAENNMLSASDAIQALLDLAESPRFAGMANRLGQTITGLWTTVKDNVQLLMRDIGKVIIEGFDLKGASRELISFFDFLRNRVNDIRPAIILMGQVFRATFDVIIASVKVAVTALAGWTKGLDIDRSSLAAVRSFVLDMFEKASSAAMRLANTMQNAAAVVLEKFGAPLLRILSHVVRALEFMIEKAGGINNLMRILAPGLKLIVDNLGKIGGAGGGGEGERLSRFADDVERAGKALGVDPNRGLAGVRGFFADVRGHPIGRLVEILQGVNAKQAIQDFGDRIGQLNKGLGLGVFIAEEFGIKLFGVAKALDSLAQQASRSVTIMGHMSPSVGKAIEGARTPFQKLRDDLKELDMIARNALPGAFLTMGGVAGSVFGGMAAHALESAQALKGLDQARFELFEKARKDLFQFKDVPALESKSKEAGAAINKALNEQRSGQVSVEQIWKAILEQEKKMQKEIEEFREEFSKAAKNIAAG